jgi:hypothetical protein
MAPVAVPACGPLDPGSVVNELAVVPDSFDDGTWTDLTEDAVWQAGCPGDLTECLVLARQASPF